MCKALLDRAIQWMGVFVLCVAAIWGGHAQQSNRSRGLDQHVRQLDHDRDGKLTCDEIGGFDSGLSPSPE